MDNTFVIHDAEPGFRVCSYHTDRFKTGILSVNLVVPLAGNVAEKSLLPSLLCASCAEYPDLLSLNRKLAELYGAELTPSASKHGEDLVLRITMTMIGDRFALDGESIACSARRSSSRTSKTARSGRTKWRGKNASASTASKR